MLVAVHLSSPSVVVPSLSPSSSLDVTRGVSSLAAALHLLPGWSVLCFLPRHHMPRLSPRSPAVANTRSLPPFLAVVRPASFHGRHSQRASTGRPGSPCWHNTARRPWAAPPAHFQHDMARSRSCAASCRANSCLCHVMLGGPNGQLKECLAIPGMKIEDSSVQN